MNATEIAMLASLGALPSPALNAEGQYETVPTGKQTIGRARNVFSTGDVEIVAFCADGTRLSYVGAPL